MKFFRLSIIGFLVLSLLATTPLTISRAEKNDINKETQIEIELEKSLIDDDGNDDKDTIYTPTEPIQRRILPNTGEIISSFIHIILGLSILLFLFGILVSRLIQNDVRWDYE